MGAADASAGAGDDGNASFEKTGHVLLLWCGVGSGMGAEEGAEDWRLAAAVALDRGAGDIGGEVGGQEGDDVADVMGLGQPAKREDGPDCGHTSEERRGGDEGVRRW